jgi:tRNA-dihydrouridine synthase B
MISSHSLLENRKKTTKTNCNRNFDNYADEGLVGAQIFGAEPSVMADAAKILEQNGAAWIDINMGCPVPKVATRAGAGAFLMRDHVLAGRIVAAVARAVKIPVGIKTRLGWDDGHLDSAELLRIAADAGARYAALHGRTRAQGYSGAADWAKCAGAKSRAGIPDFPVIFNGDIRSAENLAKIKQLGADGAMIGRALLGNPWLLGELSGGPGGRAPTPRKELVLEHLEHALSYYGARAGVPLFRKHAAWYAGGMPGAAAFRTIVNRISDADAMRREIGGFFQD